MNDVVINNISFSYGDKEVIKNLSLRLSPGKKTVLLGRSGMGKTTLLRLILGFLSPDKGSISGLEPGSRISCMYQEDRLFPQLTVYKNLKLVRRSLSTAEAEGLLKELGLESGVLYKKPRELSGGMKRRIALVRALIFDSELLIMDEPFQGLDGDTRALAIAAVNKYCGNRPLLLISHEPEDAAALGAESVSLEDISEGCAENE